MKKIWSYIAVGFAFFSAGLIAMYKIIGDTISIEIKKVKNKRVSGEVNTTIPINVDSRKAKRKQASERKLKRLDKDD